MAPHKPRRFNEIVGLAIDGSVSGGYGLGLSGKLPDTAIIFPDPIGTGLFEPISLLLKLSDRLNIVDHHLTAENSIVCAECVVLDAEIGRASCRARGESLEVGGDG